MNFQYGHGRCPLAASRLVNNFMPTASHQTGRYVSEMDPVEPLRNRITDWQLHRFTPPLFTPNPPIKPILVPDPKGPPPYVKYTDGKGIRAAERYKRKGTMEEMYAQLVPSSRWLARTLADADEREIFAMSESPTSYNSNYVSHAMKLNQQVTFEKQLQSKK